MRLQVWRNAYGEVEQITDETGRVLTPQEVDEVVALFGEIPSWAASAHIADDELKGGA